MNKLKIFLAMTGILLLNSCEKDKESADLSRVTNYPTFDMQGDELIFHNEGTPFEDPGVTATEAGVDLEVNKSVHGTYRSASLPEVDADMADHYVITYSAQNQEGFTGSVTRDVWVATTGDLVNSIEGVYTSTVERDGVSAPEYTDMEYVLIWKNEDGTYGISDGIGGYYAMGRNYGIAYVAEGVEITANDIPSNDFSFNNPFPVGAFGGSAEMKDMVVDPGAGTITFTTDWDAGGGTMYSFDVTLTQVQF